MTRDIRLSVDLFSNRKIIRLTKQLGPEGVLSLIRLWCRVALLNPDGELSGWSQEDIAIEAGWPGDPLYQTRKVRSVRCR